MLMKNLSCVFECSYLMIVNRHPDKCPECTDEYVKINTAHENIQKYGEMYKMKRALNLKTTKFPSMRNPRSKDEL